MNYYNNFISLSEIRRILLNTYLDKSANENAPVSGGVFMGGIPLIF